MRMTKYDKVGRKKERLTISLPKELLAILDKTIDGKEIRNRSHAIEHFLGQSLKPSMTTAVILAGKIKQAKIHPALTKIGGRFLLDISLEHLADSGIRTVYILAGIYREKLRVAIRQHSYGMKIIWVDEKKPKGTGGALSLLKENISEPFLVFHGDILTNIPIQPFIDFHFHEQTLVTIAVKPRQSEPEYGQVSLEGNRIKEFSERDKGVGISIVNTGVYMMNPEIFSYLDEDSKPFKIEAKLFPKLAAINELSAFFFQGMWFDVSMHNNLNEIINRFNKERGK